MREVVEEREDDAKGLLHAHEAVKGPFAVELVDVRGSEGEGMVGDNVLTCVVAFRGAGPEEKAAVESYLSVSEDSELIFYIEDIRIGVGSSPQLVA